MESIKVFTTILLQSDGGIIGMIMMIAFGLIANVVFLGILWYRMNVIEVAIANLRSMIESKFAKR